MRPITRRTGEPAKPFETVTWIEEPRTGLPVLERTGVKPPAPGSPTPKGTTSAGRRGGWVWESSNSIRAEASVCPGSLHWKVSVVRSTTDTAG